MGAFASGFFLGRLIFTPFALRLLALALFVGFAAEARYGAHERLLYWLTYRQLHQDDSWLVRLVDLNEPWLSWAVALTYTGLAALFVISLARLLAISGTLLEIVLAGLREGVTWLAQGLLVSARGRAHLTQRAWQHPTNPTVRRVQHVAPDVLDPLPAGVTGPRRVR